MFFIGCFLVPSFVHMFFGLPSFCLFPFSLYCSFFTSRIPFPYLICHMEDNIFTSGNIFFMTVCRFNLADLFRGRGLRKWFLRTGRAKKDRADEMPRNPWEMYLKRAFGAFHRTSGTRGCFSYQKSANKHKMLLRRRWWWWRACVTVIENCLLKECHNNIVFFCF